MKTCIYASLILLVLIPHAFIPYCGQKNPPYPKAVSINILRRAVIFVRMPQLCMSITLEPTPPQLHTAFLTPPPSSLPHPLYFMPPASLESEPKVVLCAR